MRVSLLSEPFFRVGFSAPLNVRQCMQPVCGRFRWDIDPHRWHHSNCTDRVEWESNDELQSVWPFPIFRWICFRRWALHSILMVSPDFVVPDWNAGSVKICCKLIVPLEQNRMWTTYWSQLKFHLASGGTIVFVVHELATCVSWARFKYM